MTLAITVQTIYQLSYVDSESWSVASFIYTRIKKSDAYVGNDAVVLNYYLNWSI